jgi:hypothetical protein
MKYLLIIMVLLLVTVPILSCTNVPDTPAVAFATVTQITSLQTAIDKHTAEIAAKANKGDVDSMIARLNAAEQRMNTLAAPNLTNYYSKAEVDTAIANAITAYKATLGTSGTTPPSTTGQITYTQLNPQQWYTFNTSGIVAVRITNGKADSRYIRPQLTMNVYPSSTTPAILTSGTCVVTSNSQGQPPIIFGSAGLGTPVTAWATCQQILFIPTSGGMSAGQYLLTPGGTMDIYMTITLAPAYPGLWTLSVSGTDVSMSSGT